MLSLSGLFIYPVKSLAGISLTEAEVQERGLRYDRRWMLVDEEGIFLTQRDLPQMATIGTAITEDGLVLRSHQLGLSSLRVGLEAEGDSVQVQVWRDGVNAKEVNTEANEWLSDTLGHNCRLVWMPDETRRLVDTDYAHDGEVTSFSDGFPFLVLGQESLDDLNNRLDEPVPADRFRANFLFEGGSPFEEDNWGRFRIGDVEFEVLKPCSRCVITTTNQQTGRREGKEPLKTLATYRAQQGKVYFAQNAVARSLGMVRVGDAIEVLSRGKGLFAA